MKTRTAIGVCALALTSLAWFAPLAPAQYTYNSSGAASIDDHVYRATISRHPDEFGFTMFTLGISELVVDPEQGLVENVIVFNRFHAEDNFNPDPSALAFQAPYEAFSAEPGIDFHLFGVQVSRMVSAVGTYEGYRLEINPSFFGV